MFKVVSDSSSNVFTLPGVDFESVPLKINAADQEYTDNEQLDLDEMLQFLRHYKGKSGSSCPNFQEWTDSFLGADWVFAATITSKMSGSYSAAAHAAEEFMAEHPDKKVFVLDSLSAGPGIQLQLEKLRDLINQGLSFEAIKEQILNYRSHVHLLFSAESMYNLGQNGRCSPTLAKIAGVLGIRLVGEEKDGDLNPLHKCRGEKRTLDVLASEIANKGFGNGRKIRIAHCKNLQAAETLKDKILSRFPEAEIAISDTTALCSFYVEKGGLMIGFEDSEA